MFGMSPTFDQGLSPVARGAAAKNSLLVFAEIDATNMQTIEVPSQRKVRLVAELYGGGGPGAGGGYNTGGGSGGGGACTVFEGTINGPCKLVLQPGGAVAGAIYGSTPATDGSTSQISILYGDGSAAVITTALGGRRGTVNPVTSAAGGPASQQGRVAGAQFEGTVRSFVGGSSSTASGRPVGFPAGPDGAANGSTAGAGNRSGTFGRGGAGDSTLNSGSTSTGSPGAAGRIFAKGVR